MEYSIHQQSDRKNYSPYNCQLLSHNIEINYRFRFQHQFSIKKPTTKFRVRLGSKYNIKNWKLDPAVSAELFYHSFTKENASGNTMGQESTMKVNEWERLRITVGTDYDIKNVGKLDMFWRYERDLNKKNPTACLYCWG